MKLGKQSIMISLVDRFPQLFPQLSTSRDPRMVLRETESPYEIIISFRTPKEFRYADVASFAAVFSSLLRRLEKVVPVSEGTSVQPDGQESLSSGVNSEV